MDTFPLPVFLLCLALAPLTSGGQCTGEWLDSRCDPTDRDNCRYIASWTYVPQHDAIDFDITGRQHTNTWIGLGISTVKRMENADVYLSWQEFGRTRFFDGYISGHYSLPQEDLSNDITDASLTVGDGKLKFHFRRKRDTGDARDHAFNSQSCYYLLFPVGGGGFLRDTIQRHQSTPEISNQTICIGPCPVQPGQLVWSCGFEQDTCGAVGQDPWTTGSSTPSASTGPSSAQAGQRFLFLEASRVRSSAETSSVILPRQVGSPSPVCVDFYYHMYGAEMGVLELLAGSRVLWVRDRNVGDRWIHMGVTVYTTSETELISFRASGVRGIRSDMAFDSVEVRRGSCPQMGGCILRCNFDDEDCAITQSSTDDVDWIPHTGMTPSSNTGPPSGQAQSLGYMYVEATGMRANTTARFSSEYLSANGAVCIQYYFHMRGDHIGSLNLYLEARGFIGSPRQLLHLEGDHGPNWHNQSFKTTTPSPFRITWEAVLTGGYQGDIAIDSICLRSCGDEPPETTTEEPDDVTSEICPHQLVCDFDEDCNLTITHRGDSSVAWRVHSGSTTSSLTGPMAGFGGSGRYLYMEASDPISPGDMTWASLPSAIPANSALCVQFAFHMHGDHIGSLELQQVTERSGRTVVWSRSGDQGDQWQVVRVATNVAALTSQISFKATRGSGYQGDIAIDAISVICGGCGGDANTTTTTTTSTTTQTTTLTTTRNPEDDVAVRIVPVSRTSGRVEVFFMGVWGTVCADLFDNEDANVMCRHAGKGKYGGVVRNGPFAAGSGPIWLDNVECRGNETGITDCRHDSWGVHDCRHDDDAHVRCFNDTVPNDVTPGPCTDEFTCHFDQSCGVTVSHRGNRLVRWRRRSGRTPDPNTGPVSGYGGGGLYVYMDTSDPIAFRDATWLTLPALFEPRIMVCVQFAYHMRGAHVGTLSLEVVGVRGEWMVLWGRSGNQGDDWKVARVTIYLPRSQSQITWKGTKGNGTEGNIALDAISVRCGSCDLYTTTTMTTTTMTTTATPTPSGIKRVWMSETFVRKYVYPEVLSCSVSLFAARLCDDVSFSWYFPDDTAIQSQHAGFTVQTLRTTSPSSECVSRLNITSINYWKTGVYKCQAAYGQQRASALAVITIYPTGPEPLPPTTATPKPPEPCIPDVSYNLFQCDYENGLCGTYNDTTEPSVWLLSRGMPNQLPSDGMFVTMDARRIRCDNRASFFTPELCVSHGDVICVSFNWFLSGNGVGMLNVTVGDQLIFNTSTNTRQWYSTDIPVLSVMEHTQVKFTAMAAGCDYGFIGVDNIRIVVGDCLQSEV